MRFPRARPARAGSRLFLVYAIASLVPVLALGALLLHGYRQEARDRALDQGHAQAGLIEEMAVAPVVGRRDLGQGLREQELEDLLDATDLAIFSGSVKSLRVRSFTGRVVFSDDGKADGALPAEHPAFRTAARGGTSVALVDDPAGGAKVIRALQPIVPNASGQATGVLEVYLPYAAVAKKVEAQLRRTSQRVAGALVLLYLVLALISWSTTRRLRRHAAEREHQALHDPLTGLPNREEFRLRAERAVRGREVGEKGAIVLVDLDRFKEVNDTLGHHAGDELLQVVARRLRLALRTDDVIARLGGDEFGLVLHDLRSADEALELLGRVREHLAAELELEHVTVGIEASFGIALFPDHGATVEELLRHADAAMYRGKRGTAGVVVFDGAGADERATGALVLQTEVRQALERDELELHYQPKLSLATGRVSGVEALLRWNHPQRGLLSAGEFLPAVEQSGLIGPLTAWVLRRALEDRRGWVSGGADWPVAVNVSARNLEASGFASSVLTLLRTTGTSPDALVLEVTETALAGNAALARQALERLAAHGLAISLDDFGMGYTSLSQLRTLPVAEIKIDRAFVTGLETSAQDRSIVRSIVELGHGLGATITAEGVEDAPVMQWLRAARCDSAQGWHVGRPMRWPDLLDRFGAVPVADLQEAS